MIRSNNLLNLAQCREGGTLAGHGILLLSINGDIRSTFSAHRRRIAHGHVISNAPDFL
jgi:hypothetical protein